MRKEIHGIEVFTEGSYIRIGPGGYLLPAVEVDRFIAALREGHKELTTPKPVEMEIFGGTLRFEEDDGYLNLSRTDDPDGWTFSFSSSTAKEFFTAALAYIAKQEGQA